MRELYSKDINFIPPRIVERKRRRRQNRIILLVLVMIISAAGAISILQERTADAYRIKIDAVDREITVLEKAAPVYDKLEQTKQEYRAKQEAMARIEKENRSFIDIFDRISLALPAGVYISSLKYRAGESLELGVAARDPVDVAGVVVALRDTGLFEEVTLQGKSIPVIPAGEPVVFNLVFAGAGKSEAENDQQSNQDEGDNNAAGATENEIKSIFNHQT